MIQRIDRESVHKICSGQVVVDLATAVKELVENSLDAGATAIDIKLKNMGVDLIEVSDNGSGISPENYDNIALKHHTSKLVNFKDLETVNSFGFRGEAVNALCELSGTLSISTKQASQTTGFQLSFGRDGRLLKREAMVRAVGTTVQVEALFQALPVRRSEFSRTIKRQYQRMIKVMQSYAVISVGVRMTLTNTTKSSSRQIVLNTQCSRRIEDNISAVFGSKFLASLVSLSVEVDLALAAETVTETVNEEEGSLIQPSLDETADDQGDEKENLLTREMLGVPPDFMSNGLRAAKSHESVVTDTLCPVLQGTTATSAVVTPYPGDDAGDDFVGIRPSDVPDEAKANLKSLPTNSIVRISGFVSKVGLGVGRSDNERQFLFLNKRPIDCSKLTKAVNEVWRRYDVQHKPAFIISLIVPSGYYDVNITPDKREVVLVQQSAILAGLRAELERLFAPSRFSFPLGQCQVLQCSTGALFARSTSSLRPVAVPGNSMSPSPSRTQETWSQDLDVNRDKEQCVEDRFGVFDSEEVTLYEGTETTCAADARHERGDHDSEPKRQAIRWTSPQSDIARYLQTDTEADMDGTYFSQNSQPLSGKFMSRSRSDDPQDGTSPSRKSLKRPYEDLTLDTSDNCASADDGAYYKAKDVNPHMDSNVSHGASMTGRPTEVHNSGQTLTIPTALWDVDFERILSDFRSASSEDIRRRHRDRRKFINFRKCLISKDSRSRSECDDSAADVHSSGLEVQSGPHESGLRSADGSLCASTEEAEDKLTARVLDRKDFTKMRVIGQFNLGFILAELRGDLFILDQHACDEKFRFEALQKSTVIHQQPLLSPLVVECSPAEELIIEENVPAFEENGFKICIDEDALVGRRIRLSAVPFSKGVQFNASDVLELASMLMSGECGSKVMLVNDGGNAVSCKRYPRLPKLLAMYASRACRRAVMIGTGLHMSQMQKLVSQMGDIEQPWCCPHGRPTMRHVTDLNDLKRLKPFM